MAAGLGKVAVTGAGGFIGSHLVEALVERGVEVRALVHYNARNDWGNLERLAPATLARVEVRALDITDPFAVDEAIRGVDTVFHLAALIGIPYSYVAPAHYVDVNVRGTVNVLEASRRNGVARLVHTSTSEVYGTARYTPIDEAHPLQGQSPYSASKIGADKLAESYHLAFGLRVATLRPFNAFGPRQSARAVIPTIISQIAAGHDVIRLGNLSPVRDFTFVADTCRAFIAVAESDRTVGTVCNAGAGKGITIGELANRIAALMGSSVAVVEDRGRMRADTSEVFELIACADRLRELTGWTPTVTLDEGLLRTIEDVTGRASSLKPTLYTI